MARSRIIAPMAWVAVAALSGAAAAAEPLVIAADGRSSAVVVVSPTAGPWEKRAAADLAHYVGVMTGAKPALADTNAAAGAALKTEAPLLLVGAAALSA